MMREPLNRRPLECRGGCTMPRTGCDRWACFLVTGALIGFHPEAATNVLSASGGQAWADSFFGSKRRGRVSRLPRGGGNCWPARASAVYQCDYCGWSRIGPTHRRCSSVDVTDARKGKESTTGFDLRNRSISGRDNCQTDAPPRSWCALLKKLGHLDATRVRIAVWLNHLGAIATSAAAPCPRALGRVVKK